METKILNLSRAMEQGDHPILEYLEVGGYRIEIVHEESPENPFEEWDCELPIFVHGDQYRKGYDEFEGGMQLPTLDRKQIIANWRDLVPDEHRCSTLISTIRRWLYSLYCWDKDEDIVELINERIECEFESLNDSDSLEYAATVFNAAGIPAAVHTVNGSVQSAWAEVLAVITPKWQEKVGVTIVAGIPDPDSVLKQTALLYGAWAFGDVVGFTIAKLKPDCECCGSKLEPEDVDACYGYYGFSRNDRDNPDYSGVYEAILENLPEEVEETFN